AARRRTRARAVPRARACRHAVAARGRDAPPMPGSGHASPRCGRPLLSRVLGSWRAQLTRLSCSAVRVLYVGNMYPPHDLGGGYELTCRSSVLHLREHGHEVRVLTTDYHSPALDRDYELDPDVHR